MLIRSCGRICPLPVPLPRFGGGASCPSVRFPKPAAFIMLSAVLSLSSCFPLSPPPQRRGQGWWFALPRSSAGAIKMRPRLPLERICGAVRTMPCIVRIQPQLSVKGVCKGESLVPLCPVLLPFAGAKGRPPRRAVLTMPLQKAPRRRQATTYLAKILLFIFPHRKVTPSGQVYRPSPFDDSATPPSDHQPSHKPHSTPFLPRKDDPHA